MWSLTRPQTRWVQFYWTMRTRLLALWLVYHPTWEPDLASALTLIAVRATAVTSLGSHRIDICRPLDSLRRIAPLRFHAPSGRVSLLSPQFGGIFFACRYQAAAKPRYRSAGLTIRQISFHFHRVGLGPSKSRTVSPCAERRGYRLSRADNQPCPDCHSKGLCVMRR